MKKLYVLFLPFLFVAIVLGSCYLFTNHEGTIPALLERKTEIGPEIERAAIQTTYNSAVTALASNPDDLKQYIKLASAFIMEGRITGNGSYYGNAAVKMLNKLIDDVTTDKDLKFQAFSLKSAVMLNMHQFKDALVTAKLGLAMNDYNAGIYGALVDANVELGHYDAAVKYCDKMISIRPDLRSYSRASYLRQIYGDNAGAIEAMKMAVEAGVPGAEGTEWARVTLGDLYLNTGRTDSAFYQYERSLAYRPKYPYAEMGLARALRAVQKFDDAIVHAKNAIRVFSDISFVSFLGDLYALKGDNQKAAQVHNDIVTQLLEAEYEQPADVVVKHNSNRELATAYMNIRNYDKAIEYAKIDLAMRPENIDANELVAWILYLKKDYKAASVYAGKMLRMNTQNATLLYKASLIYSGAGDAAKSSRLRVQAMKISPYVDQRVLIASK